jgi:hypothetical protein
VYADQGVHGITGVDAEGDKEGKVEGEAKVEVKKQTEREAEAGREENVDEEDIRRRDVMCGSVCEEAGVGSSVGNNGLKEVLA